jgi:hypothetical protein
MNPPAAQPLQQASLREARGYFRKLALELWDYLDEDYQRALDTLMEALEQLFDILETIDLQARDGQRISAPEATELGNHGIQLLMRLIDLTEKLDLPHKRHELEQVSLLFARWTLRHGGELQLLEPLVNAFAHAANQVRERSSLRQLAEWMGEVADAASSELKQDLGGQEPYRPWRLLHINRGIIATRSQDTELMRRVFDEMMVYLPQEAARFFEEGLEEMDNAEYPPHVRQVIEEYHARRHNPRLH